jgi:hypothetical protein
VDQQIGRLRQYPERSGQLDRTLWVITADHGELLGERGIVTHGRSLHEGEARVPLLLHWPRGLQPRDEYEPVSQLDILPTVLELIGVPPHPSFQGTNFADIAPHQQAGAAILINIQGLRSAEKSGQVAAFAVRSAKVAVTGLSPHRPRRQITRHFPALLLWSVMACTGTTHTNNYAVAGAALGGAVVGAALHRALTGDCWALCRSGLICDRESGKCVPGECAPGCQVGQHCVRDVDGSTHCEDQMGAVTWGGSTADAGVAPPAAADAAAPLPSADAATPPSAADAAAPPASANAAAPPATAKAAARPPSADAGATTPPSEADAAAAPPSPADATAPPTTAGAAGSKPGSRP